MRSAEPNWAAPPHAETAAMSGSIPPTVPGRNSALKGRPSTRVAAPQKWMECGVSLTLLVKLIQQCTKPRIRMFLHRCFPTSDSPPRVSDGRL